MAEHSLDYAIIGVGNMGHALAAALVERRVCPPERLLGVDPDAAARERLGALGCETAATLIPRVGEARVVLLAVKPQSAAEVLPAVGGHLRAGQTVLSIMAGVPLEALQRGLGHPAVVRAMPNTPAQIGRGMTVYCPAEGVDAAVLAHVEALFRACGEVVRVDDEDLIDAATAVSGSGPAYVFYLAEHWIHAARELGFDEAQAVRMVQQTLLGATELWRSKSAAPRTLRERVTSRGGTTEAALDVFQDASVGTGFEHGVLRAYARAKELSG